jgi:hypothetical protein
MLVQKQYPTNINIFNFQNFVNDFSAVVVDRAFEGQEKTILLNEVVCEHFMRQGMLDVADAVIHKILKIKYIGA